MNKRFVAATTMMAMFVTTAAAATAYQKSITATYGIGLEINGNKANLTDVNGKTVEPFTYNGTTYVPIRAVAENMGSYVGYDASTKTAIVYQDDTEAIVFAHKIAEASQHMHGIIVTLYSTCTARRDNLFSVSQAKTGIQDLVDADNITMSEIENTYKILQDNSNIYLSDINNCMSALRYERQAVATAATNAVSYANSPSSSLLTRMQNDMISLGLRKGAQSYVDDFINSMWSYE